MLQKIFIFGIILPTIVTVLIFIAFLICWFKFDLRGKLFPKKKGDFLDKSASFQSQPSENLDSQVNFMEENCKDDMDDHNNLHKGDKSSKSQSSFIFRINGHLSQPYQPMEDCLSITEEESISCNPSSSSVGAFNQSLTSPVSEINYENCHGFQDKMEQTGNNQLEALTEEGLEAKEASLVIQTFEFHEHDNETLQCVGNEETDCDDTNYSELVPKSRVNDDKWDKAKHKQFKKWRDKQWAPDQNDINETDSETSKLVMAT